jgi:hypothetical protein
VAVCYTWDMGEAVRRLAHRVALVLLATLAIGSMSVAALSRRGARDGPVYTVNQVTAGLSQHPVAWSGRTIRVRGLIEQSYATCGGPVGWCVPSSYILVGYPSAQPNLPIPTLTLHPEADPVLNALRRIPGLGTWIARPQPLLGTGVFLLKLRAVTTRNQCGAAPCYVAVLVDAVQPLS